LKEVPVQNAFVVIPKEGSRRLTEAFLKEVRRRPGELSEYTLFTLLSYLIEASIHEKLEQIFRDAVTGES
jgi:hypothetical protein